MPPTWDWQPWPAIESVAVVGAGEWGTALAPAVATAGRRVTLIGRDAAVLAEISRDHTQHPAILGKQRLSPHDQRLDRILAAPISFSSAVPAQASRAALAALGRSASRSSSRPRGSRTERCSGESEILAEVAPCAVPFVLSGPSFAVDVAAGRLTAVTLAGDDDDRDRGDRRSARRAELSALCRVRPGRRRALRRAQDHLCLGGRCRRWRAARRLGPRRVDCARLRRARPHPAGAGWRCGNAHGARRPRRPHPDAAPRRSRATIGYGVALGRGEAPPLDLAEGVVHRPGRAALGSAAGIDAPLIEAVNLLLGKSQSIERIVAGLMSRPLKREN